MSSSGMSFRNSESRRANVAAPDVFERSHVRRIEMRSCAFCKLTRAALLSLSLTLVPFASLASAQARNPDRGTADAARVEDTRAERPSNWGWLGLLGLTGLLGLLPRGDRVRHRVLADSGSHISARP
jgi:hypothetical protein